MATTSYDAGYSSEDAYDVRGGGWITFAAVMLGLAGTFNVLEGILAIANSRVYTAHQTFVFSNLNTWGWIMLLIGLIQVAAAGSLWRGGLFGRIFGIAAASLSAIGALLSIPAYPFWSLAIFAIDVVVIHQIATRGTQGRRVA